MSTRIKICGITNVEDAEVAIAAGAHYLGLIFVDSSARRVSMKEAARIVEVSRGKARTVGVFKDGRVDAINSCVIELGLDMVQCHGKESVNFCSAITAPIIKAIEVKEEADVLDQTSMYQMSVQHLMFDRPKDNADARWLGEAICWIEAAGAQLNPFFFAGGLTAENVASAVKRLRPFAVDVASGVESSPGRKDHAQVRQFCDAVAGALQGEEQ